MYILTNSLGSKVLSPETNTTALPFKLTSIVSKICLLLAYV
jgi:hypothetical protein